ncbi:MAG TPA: type II secretion system protein [Candidatus Paceibacterota bacterium]
MPNSFQKKSGFTILELLVVMAIVALGLSIISVFLVGLKAKSRDAARMSHLEEITKALNLYYTNNGKFPALTTETVITGSDALSDFLEGDGVIKEAQKDPSGGVNQYTYQSNANGTDYTITFCLETNSNKKYTEGCGNTMKP